MEAAFVPARLLCVAVN